MDRNGGCYRRKEITMDLVTVRELYRNREQYLGKKVTVGGWVRSVRDSKAFGFIVLNDGTFFETLQVVYHDTMDNFAEVSKLNVGSAIIVTGELVATPEAKQPFEIQAEAVQALVALGYGNTESMKAVQKVQMDEDTTVEEVLKLALKNMMF